METVPANSRLGMVLDWADALEASDLHVRAGRPMTVRVHGRLVEVPERVCPSPDEAMVQGLLNEAFPEAVVSRIVGARELDLSFSHGPRRYRANFSKQQGKQSCSFRVVPRQEFSLAELQLPESLRDLVQGKRGLVLVTGPTGQGKSTTVRALLQELNLREAVRVITIEDPIEYLFEDKLAQFEQREVGIDTATFADGIRNAMRQDPNVLFIGEIRDRESIFAALQAAETGHLVLTTLHADSVSQAVGRLREYYPATEQDSVSGLLARNLNAIVCQRLLPNLQGTRTPCLEVLKKDAGVSDAIRKNDLELLAGIVEASVHEGMHTFDQYLVELLSAGIVSAETARAYAVNRQRLELTLRGIGSTQGILKPDPR